MHAKLEKVLIKFAYIERKDYFCTRFKDQWFRSSVGLEQQPSKLWVLGSNPNGITIISKMKLICTKLAWENNGSKLLIYRHLSLLFFFVFKYILSLIPLLCTLFVNSC